MIHIKKAFSKILNLCNISIRSSLLPGVSLGSFNFYIDPFSRYIHSRSAMALKECLKLRSEKVLDVGSRSGEHAMIFRRNGAEVTCIDFGTSVYAEKLKDTDLLIINQDFNYYQSSIKYDLVWASHVLEHQRNIGLFIGRLIECTTKNGWVCITVPDPHRNLWGGHLSLWSPGMLAYNIVLCGVDLSNARFVRGANEFSILFQVKRIELPVNLTYDKNDIDKLSVFFPSGLEENSNPWEVNYLNI